MARCTERIHGFDFIPSAFHIHIDSSAKLVYISFISEQLRRKLSLRLCPTPKQEAILTAWMDLHREIYNAALQERIDCYHKTGQNFL